MPQIFGTLTPEAKLGLIAPWPVLSSVYRGCCLVTYKWLNLLWSMFVEPLLCFVVQKQCKLFIVQMSDAGNGTINAWKMSVDFWKYISWFKYIISAENQSLKLKLLQSAFLYDLLSMLDRLFDHFVFWGSLFFYFLAVLLISKYILVIFVSCNLILPLLPVSNVIWS